MLLKRKKIPRFIIDDIEIYPDYFRKNLDEENFDEKKS